MPVTRIYVFVLASLLCVDSAQAKDGYDLMGVGANSCAKFAKDYQSAPELWGNFYFFWAQGWMSGFNSSRVAKEKRDLNSIGVDAQERFLRDYCDNHPLEDYRIAVLNLYFGLKVRSDIEIRE